MRIVAEIGSNWKSLSDILESCKKASEIDVDVVKLQLFNRSEMYLGNRDVKTGITPYLNPDWLQSISAYCNKLDIEFMCTAFSPEGYKLVNKYVNIHKVASAEITDLDILSTLNAFKKPVYLSTGGASLEQVKVALEVLKNCKVTIFYCVTEYPAKVVDFRHLTKLVETFKRTYEYGYSDHSIDVLNIPKIAMYHGASVLEKHVNFTEHTDTDDAPHALNLKECGLMVKSLRGDDISLYETKEKCSWQRKPFNVKAELRYYRSK